MLSPPPSAGMMYAASMGCKRKPSSYVTPKDGVGRPIIVPDSISAFGTPFNDRCGESSMKTTTASMLWNSEITTPRWSNGRKKQKNNLLSDAPLLPASPDFEDANINTRFHVPIYSPVTATTAVNPNYIARFSSLLSTCTPTTPHATPVR